VEQNRLGRGAPSVGESLTLERLFKELQALAAEATQAGAPVFLPGAESLTGAELLSAAQELRAALESIIEAAKRQMLAFQRIETELPEAVQRRARHAEVVQELKQRRVSASAAEERLAALGKERDAITQRLAELRAAIEAAKATADAFGAFLLSALAYVHDPTCPVCEQAIKPEQVAARLSERAALVPQPLRLLEDERQELELREMNLTEQAAEPQASASSLREKIQALEAEQSELEQRIAHWQAILAAVGSAGDPDPGDVATQRETEKARLLAGEQLAQRVDGILAQVRYLVSEDRRSRLTEEEERFRSERANLTAALERAESSRTILNGITAAAKESELDIVRRLMVEQQPLLNALYRRLRPHPVLDQIDVDFGEFGQRGEVYFHAVAGNTRANVSAIFSSAQLNAVAICVFLALNISAGAAGFALLDDPIQNMDDFNVLGLLDMLRAISEGRQVIVSTHDVQLGELIRRKLRPLRKTRRTITHEFIGYGELGPEIKTEIDEFADPPQLLPALVA
jgi:DNA repair exonuclease SbcCD ATPase subunit